MKFSIIDFGKDTVTFTVKQIMKTELKINSKLNSVLSKQGNEILKTSGSFEIGLVTYHLAREISEEEAEEISQTINSDN